MALVLNDEGRSQVQRQVGPFTTRIEGKVLQATDADLLMAVTDVVDVRGARSKWTGERVPLPRSYVMMGYERRFSKPKTILLGAAVTAGFVALVASFKLFGFGGGGNNDGQPPDGMGQ